MDDLPIIGSAIIGGVVAGVMGAVVVLGTVFGLLMQQGLLF